jgi:DNA-directed RNA polymerase specialized sigma24 family protein
MPTVEPITDWICQLQAADRTAAGNLWDCYFPRLVRLARQVLQGAPRRAADEEDVALSAFDSFCRGAEQGRFPQLNDRDNLWQLLVAITVRKALDQIHHERRQKRGGGKVRGESALQEGLSSDLAGIEQIASQEPTPESAALMADECRRLFQLLDDDELRQIALWRMEGYTTEEIAGKRRCSLRRVERKLRLIRTIWEKTS